jgi:uncharacterized protein (TIGR00255 family)
MTGYSKAEVKEKGFKVIVEIKSLNGKYLEINARLPKVLSHKELEARDLIKGKLSRGSVYLNISLEEESGTNQFALNEKAAAECYTRLNQLKTKLKIKEPVTLDHLLTFSGYFQNQEDNDNTEIVWKAASKAINEALKELEAMRRKEGIQMAKDLKNRMNAIKEIVDNVESLGIKRIPEERERIRQRIAQLFESDEIDEQRLQFEMVMLADKLDISEECVRLNSHIKFFFETMKDKEPSGRKITFLLQEMNREINTIGSKANDATISQFVVGAKEELEKIREQIQNIE